jgi:hypothetical protein
LRLVFGNYSLKNVAFLAAQGCRNAQYVPLGYSRRLERIVQASEKNFDICFYGARNHRRALILDALAARVRVVSNFGIYGAARDHAIARSKIILNLHQFDISQLEQVRVSYLLNNRCFVISESSEGNPYQDGLVFSEYDNIVDCCVSYLRPEMDSERARFADAGYLKLREIPMVANIRSELELLEGMSW